MKPVKNHILLLVQSVIFYYFVSSVFSVFENPTIREEYNINKKESWDKADFSLP